MHLPIGAVLAACALPLCWAVASPGWRLLGRGINGSGSWRVRGLSFFSSSTCAAESRIYGRAHCGESCSVYNRADGSPIAGPASPSPASYALLSSDDTSTGDLWWRSRGSCHDAATPRSEPPVNNGSWPELPDYVTGDCFIGFLWGSYQRGLPGLQAGFSADRGLDGAARFASATDFNAAAVEPQCIALEQADWDSNGGGANELIVQYLAYVLTNASANTTDWTWKTLSTNLGPVGAGNVRLRVPLS